MKGGTRLGRGETGDASDGGRCESELKGDEIWQGGIVSGSVNTGSVTFRSQRNS
jgi:hypothetical protein